MYSPVVSVKLFDYNGSYRGLEVRHFDGTITHQTKGVLEEDILEVIRTEVQNVRLTMNLNFNKILAEINKKLDSKIIIQDNPSNPYLKD